MQSADDPRRRRIRFRAWHRGFREADLILGPFADRHVDQLSEGQLDQLEALMEAPDQDLYDWIVGRAPAPDAFETDMLAMVRDFRFEARTARAESAV